MPRWLQTFERWSSFAVGACYGVTAGIVGVVLVEGIREQWSRRDPRVDAIERAAMAPGFDPEEKARNMARAMEIDAGKPQ